MANSDLNLGADGTVANNVVLRGNGAGSFSVLNGAGAAAPISAAAVSGTTGTFSGAVSAAGVTNTGLTDISGASAGQIKFPATQNPSADANTLDDYEEGTWVPAASFSGGNGNLSLNTQVGTYTKIGRVVYCQFYLAFGETTASGNLSITGLPFAANAAANTYNRFALTADSMTGISGGCVGDISPAGVKFDVYQTTTGSLNTVTSANTGNPSSILGNFFYFV